VSARRLSPGAGRRFGGVYATDACAHGCCASISKMRTCRQEPSRFRKNRQPPGRARTRLGKRRSNKIGKGKRMESVDAIRRRSGAAAWTALLVLAALLGGAPAAAKQQEPSVTIRSGAVVGQYLGDGDDVAAFFGIPYAAP